MSLFGCALDCQQGGLSFWVIDYWLFVTYSAFPFQEYISEYDYDTGSITNSTFVPSTGRFDFSCFEDKGTLLTFIRNYLDSITHSRCSTLVYIFQEKESTYSAFYSSVFADAGFLLVIHSTLMEYYLRDSPRDYQDDDFLLVVDASGHSASLSYTCRRLGEDRFIPNSEVTEAAIVDRMVAMAAEEFTRSFDVDVGKDSYLEATLPKCCREAYQLYLRGQPRVSITLQRDEKKLKVIFGPPNFDRIYESIVRLELMKPFTRLGTVSAARLLYRVRGFGPFAEAARRLLEKDVVFVHAEPLCPALCEPCQDWRQRLMEGRVVGDSNSQVLEGSANSGMVEGSAKSEVGESQESLDYGRLLAARLREERGRPRTWWPVEEEDVEMRLSSLQAALGGVEGFVPADQDTPCLEVGERGSVMAVLDPERGLLFRRGADREEVLQDEEVVFAAEKTEHSRRVWRGRGGVYDVTSSVLNDEGEKEVCAYRCDDVGDELSVGGGRSVLRTQSQPLAVSLSGSAGAVVLSEEGVDLRVGSEEVRFGRTAVSGSRDGEGRVYFADGTRYEGEVRAGLCDGSGVLRGPHDELLTVGVWRDGKLASSLPLPPTRPSSAPANDAARVTGGDGQAAPAEVVQPADPIQPVEMTEQAEQAQLSELSEETLEARENGWVEFVDAVLARGDGLTRETASRLLLGAAALAGREEVVGEEGEDETATELGVTLTVESRVSEIPTWRVEKVDVEKYRITSKEGDMVYLGGMKNDQLEGEGVLYYKNGGKLFEGSFCRNRWNGMGTWFFPNGTLHYKGMWKDGEMDGEGMLYRPVNIEYSNSDFRRYVRHTGKKNPHLSFARGFNPFTIGEPPKS